MSDDVDSETIAVWGDAICDAIVGDRRELVELLRAGNTVTKSVAEFLAWMLEEKDSHRPPLPDKFRRLGRMARNPRLYDAFMHYKLERAALEDTGKMRPRKVLIARIAKMYDIKYETLRVEVARARNNPKRLDR
jgi:hypothetical protein